MEKKGLVTSRTEGSRRVGDRVVKLASLAIEPEEAQTRMERKRRTAPRQCDAVDFLTRCAETSVHDLCYFTGVTARGTAQSRKGGHHRAARAGGIPHCAAHRAARGGADPAQRRAAGGLPSHACRVPRGEAGVTLLQGVTGSGKTLVYIRLAQELLREGKSVMILVPEIALTPQMMARFTAYFGAEVALLHSGLRLTERYDQYKRIRRGEAHIVLGTRSAVFAPLRELGLIVLDEEQESSYESGSAPFYHARDIAKYRWCAGGCAGCCSARRRRRSRRRTSRATVNMSCCALTGALTRTVCHAWWWQICARSCARGTRRPSAAPCARSWSAISPRASRASFFSTAAAAAASCCARSAAMCRSVRGAVCF